MRLASRLSSSCSISASILILGSTDQDHIVCIPPSSATSWHRVVQLDRLRRSSTSASSCSSSTSPHRRYKSSDRVRVVEQRADSVVHDIRHGRVLSSSTSSRFWTPFCRAVCRHTHMCAAIPDVHQCDDKLRPRRTGPLLALVRRRRTSSDLPVIIACQIRRRQSAQTSARLLFSASSSTVVTDSSSSSNCLDSCQEPQHLIVSKSVPDFRVASSSSVIYVVDVVDSRDPHRLRLPRRQPMPKSVYVKLSVGCHLQTSSIVFDIPRIKSADRSPSC